MSALFQECLKNRMTSAAVSQMYKTVFLTHVGEGTEVIDDEDNDIDGDADDDNEKLPAKMQEFNKILTLDTNNGHEDLIDDIFTDEYYEVSGTYQIHSTFMTSLYI
jgi:hypothetical protein